MNAFRFVFSFLTIVTIIIACSDRVSTQTALPTGKSQLFSGSGNCVLCHQSNGVANTTNAGVDVSQPTQWRSTMMANAAKDPFWQALVRSESAEIPELADVIQDRCTNCHIPMGHEEAHRNGDAHYSLDEGKADELAMDGVSCTVCHQITPDNLGKPESFSGGYVISNTRVAFGPYQNPTVQPMQNISGFKPEYGAHTNRSELCATCHTLFTPYVDQDNKIVGEFPEQTPFIEWKHSAYPAEDKQCQTCHMPIVEGEAFPISTLGAVSSRSPFFRHHFVGGNTFMLKMLKAHGDELGVTADARHFDSTIALTMRQLTQSTVRLTGSAAARGDSLVIDVGIENLTGHKFPTGFPARSAGVHVAVRDHNGALVFESGKPKPDGRITSIAGYEPHHQIISTGSQVQIYESVMEDVAGNATDHLLRGAKYKKDNRLPPRGFSAASMKNDTVGVHGEASLDDDFNSSGGSYGTASDEIHYIIPLSGVNGPFDVTVEMLYQSIKPEFTDHMFVHDIDEINRFKGYYQQADKSPVRIASLQLSTGQTGGIGTISSKSFALAQNYPNPASASAHAKTTIAYTLRRAFGNVKAELLNLYGSAVRVFEQGPQYAGEYMVDIPTEGLTPGMYFFKLSAGGDVQVRKLLVTR